MTNAEFIRRGIIEGKTDREIISDGHADSRLLLVTMIRAIRRLIAHAQKNL